MMRTEVIRADTIDAAAKQILDQLSEDTSATRSISSRDNVIYFDGWDGFGATAVLRAVAERLAVPSEAPAGLQFDKIIHIDCSKWESRRAMQRAIAEELKLPAEVMKMLDIQDEEDDYRGAQLGPRAEVPQVVKEIFRSIEHHRFLVIFFNGSSQEIDLTNFGFPLQDLGFHLYSRNKVLWTFQGAFRLKPRTKIEEAMKRTPGTTTTGVFLLAAVSADEDVRWSDFVRQEAADLVARRKNTGLVDHAQVANCFLYLLDLCSLGGHFTRHYDLATHGSNYWLCDGMIHQQLEEEADEGDRRWRAAQALHREMQLDVDFYYQYLPSQLVMKRARTMPCWASPTYRVTQILDGAIPSGDIFRYYHNLGVLMLSRCTLSLSSPPFLCCHNLRFLWLDHCQDQVISSTDNDGANAGKEWLQRLWVLVVRYTCCDRILSDLMTQLRELDVMGAQDYDMGQLQGRLPNIRKLRVTKSTVKYSHSSSENVDLFSWMKKMELLDFSGNRIMSSSGVRSLNMAANNSFLETIIIDEGCDGLEQVSFRGCANLKNVLLRGLFKWLKRIDISGTAVKILDLSAVEAMELVEFVALGCDKLCTILWPPEGKWKDFLTKLHIGTIMVDGTNGTLSSSLTTKYGSLALTEYYWYVFVRDTRLLWSLEVFTIFVGAVHLEISSPGLADGDGSEEESRIMKSDDVSEQLVLVNLQNRQQLPEISQASVYTDMAVNLMNHMPQASDDGDSPIITKTWPCPRAPKLHARSGTYVYIQDQPMRRTKLPLGPSDEVISTSSVHDIICDSAHILHVHDSNSIIHVPGPLEGSKWSSLKWCRVERCSSLDYVFICPQMIGSIMLIFQQLSTLWCSQLSKVRYIWNFNGLSSAHLDYKSFENMQFVHMDLCPRVTHVLPLLAAPINKSFGSHLETLEIVWCGDLSAVFPLDTDAYQSHEEDEMQRQQQKATTMRFPRLKRIRMHELPKLQGICGRQRIFAPNLVSIKIRGCWSLTCLPAVGGGEYKGKVECDCEKEWWDKLKWDTIEAKHYRSLYKPIHPRYYKKTTQLRISILR